MKRRIVASLSILMALAGRGLPQVPQRLPDAPAAGQPIPIVVPGTTAPANVSVIAPEQAKIAEGSTKPVSPSPGEPIAAPNSIAPTAAGCDCATNGKPSLLDTHTGPPEQIWARGSYLLWKVADQPLPAVLAAVNGTPVAGGEGTGVDFGNFSGGRFEVGMWLDCSHTFGVDVGGFILQKKTSSLAFASDGLRGSDTITRPFIDALTNTPSNVVVATPLGLQGSLNISSSLQLGGLEFNLDRNLIYNCNYSLTAIMGFRYIDLEETLNINQTTAQVVPVPANLPFNGAQSGFNSLAINDRFRTRNQLWAGQFGGRFETHRGMFFGELSAKVALGPNTQRSEISGFTGATGPGVAGTAPSGILALSGANAGTDTTRWFTVAPEVGIRVGAQLTNSLRAFVGYDFLYINNVVRPGDQINTIINQKFVPSSSAFGTTSGPDQPFPRTSRDDFFAHGLEFGVQFSY